MEWVVSSKSKATLAWKVDGLNAATGVLPKHHTEAIMSHLLHSVGIVQYFLWLTPPRWIGCGWVSQTARAEFHLI